MTQSITLTIPAVDEDWPEALDVLYPKGTGGSPGWSLDLGVVQMPSDWVFADGTDLGFVEQPGSPEESYDGDRVRVRRKFLGPWVNRWLFARQQVGYSYLKPFSASDQSGPSFTAYEIGRQLPQPYQDLYSYTATSLTTDPPDQGGDPVIQDAGPRYWVVPAAVESIRGVKPIGRTRSLKTPLSDRIGLYRYAEVTLEYASVAYDIVPDTQAVRPTPYGNRVDEGTLNRFVSKQVQPNSRFYTLPTGVMFWVDEDQARQVEAGSISVDQYKVVPFVGAMMIILGFTEYVYTWHAAPAIPAAARYLQGCVNMATFDGKPPGTMQYQNGTIRRYFGPHGRKQYDISYRVRHFEAVNPLTGLPYSAAYIDQDGFHAASPANARGHNFWIHYQPGQNPATKKALAWELLTDTGTKPDHVGSKLRKGATAFPTADLRDLFRFTAFRGGYEHA
jgi:hypothetical protein